MPPRLPVAGGLFSGFRGVLTATYEPQTGEGLSMALRIHTAMPDLGTCCALWRVGGHAGGVVAPAVISLAWVSRRAHAQEELQDAGR